MNKALLAFIITGFFFCANAESQQYESFGRRDPFVPLVGVPQEPGRGGVMGIYTVDDAVFGGVIYGPDGERQAILNGEILHEGQVRGRVEVLSISDNELVIRIDTIRHRLRLYE